MPEDHPLSAQQGLAALAQLGHLGHPAAIQRPGQHGLLGKTFPSPSTGQGHVRAQAGVDLADGAAARQNTDQNVLQLGRRRVIHYFQG